MDKDYINEIACVRKGKRIQYRIANSHKTNDCLIIKRYSDVQTEYHDVVKELHSHDFYSLMWFYEGKGIHIIDFLSYPIEPNIIFFISPCQLHQCLNMEDNDGIVISFSEELLNNVNKDIRHFIRHRLFSLSRDFASICKITENDVSVLKDDCVRIQEALEHPKDGQVQKYYLASLLSLFMIDIFTRGKWNNNYNKTNHVDSNIYDIFMDAVEKYFRKRHNVKDYVEEMNMSLSSLNKYITKVTGKTPSQLINERIMKEAKCLLYERMDMPIKEIAENLNFEDASNFVKFFKRYTSMTPIEFRKQF